MSEVVINTPPTLKKIDGEWWLVLDYEGAGQQSVRVSLGDGRDFTGQVIEKIVGPAIAPRALDPR